MAEWHVVRYWFCDEIMNFSDQNEALRPDIENKAIIACTESGRIVMINAIDGTLVRSLSDAFSFCEEAHISHTDAHFRCWQLPIHDRMFYLYERHENANRWH